MEQTQKSRSHPPLGRASRSGSRSRRRAGRGAGRLVVMLAAVASLAFASSCTPPSAARPDRPPAEPTASAVRIPRIGFLISGRSSVRSPTKDAFLEGLRRVGYEEGENIHIEYRFTEGVEESVNALAEELAALPVDLIVGVGTQRVVAAKLATSAIPIVATSMSDPVEAGLAESLRRPGGNVTGMAVLSGALAAKRLELLKETLPSATRIGVLATLSWNDESTSVGRQWRETQAAAPSLGVELVLVEARSLPTLTERYASLSAAFDRASAQQVDAMVLLGDQMFDVHRPEISEIAARYGLPAVHTRGDYVDHGGLMGFGVDAFELARRSAEFVDRILKGANPAELPLEQPVTYELAINLKAAQALGISISPAVLQRATQIIE